MLRSAAITLRTAGEEPRAAERTAAQNAPQPAVFIFPAIGCIMRLFLGAINLAHAAAAEQVMEFEAIGDGFFRVHDPSTLAGVNCFESEARRQQGAALAFIIARRKAAQVKTCDRRRHDSLPHHG